MTWFEQNTNGAALSTNTSERPRTRNVLAEGRRLNAERRQERAADRARISREAREGGLLSPGVAHLRNQLSMAQEAVESQPRRRRTYSDRIEGGANSAARSLNRDTRRTTRDRRIRAEQMGHVIGSTGRSPSGDGERTR